jgi:hypothetical protein
MSLHPIDTGKTFVRFPAISCFLTRTNISIMIPISNHGVAFNLQCKNSWFFFPTNELGTGR